MNDSQKVDNYINKHPKWSEQLNTLRTIFNETELKEEVKWGSPTYTLNGKLIVGMAAFKNHFAIWFHQGFFLKDKNKLLVNAQEGVTKSLRQWRFEEGDTINTKVVAAYIDEAIQNSIDGKELKPVKAKVVAIPPILKEKMKSDASLNSAFKKLTPGKQREYSDHIGSAKREITQQSRLEKCIPMILKGVGLHDKYKKC